MGLSSFYYFLETRITLASFKHRRDSPLARDWLTLSTIILEKKFSFIFINFTGVSLGQAF